MGPLSSFMGLLNRLFGSTESIAKEIEADDEQLLEQWKDYLGTVLKKRVIIEKLSLDVRLNDDLKELKLLLILELTNIHGEEKEESELISDLESLEHSKKVRRVHRLEQCLGYAETRYEYVHGLLHQLHSVLRHQMHLVERLHKDHKHTEKLISHLKSQSELEAEVLGKVEKIETFHELFLALVKGEHIIKTMDAREGRLIKRMQRGVSKIFSQEISEGITYEWAMTVFNAVQDIVMDHEAILARGLDPHPNIDFEFVNRPGFVDLARSSVVPLRLKRDRERHPDDSVFSFPKRKEVSEEMINAFVHMFREWYNHERD